MCKLHYLLAIALLLGLYGCASRDKLDTELRDESCAVAASIESELTACEAAKNCRSTPNDYYQFQKWTRACLQR